MADISPITVARFWSKVSVPQSAKACWEWQGCTDSSGYGNFRVPQFGRVNIGAHRVSYMLYNGDFPPEGLVIRHKCDNPRCVNPFHLDTGTKKDNAQDASERGRLKSRDSRGEKNPGVKLTVEQVREIRRLSRLHGPSELAKRFAVTDQTICNIKAGKTWRHVI
jgi:hypothetical protein